MPPNRRSPNMLKDDASIEQVSIIQADELAQKPGAPSPTTSSSTPPAGDWRDGFWDITKHGACHASCLQSCCCTVLAAAQVQHRLQLNHMGHPSTPSVVAAAFRKLLYLAMAFWSTRAVLLLLIAILDPNVKSTEWVDPPTAYYVFCALDDLLAYVFFGFTVVVLRNTRAHLRHKYAIPETHGCPVGCEDTCCSCCCPCFVASQMLRHTADYETQPGRCCSSNGLSSGVVGAV